VNKSVFYKIFSMKRIKKFMCFSGIIILGNHFALSQNIQLFHCMVDLQKPQQEVMNQFGIKEAILLDGRYIDPNKTGKIDSLSLVKAINQYFPRKNDTGLGLLDLEDENYEALKSGKVKNISLEVGLEQMLRMVNIAKKERPNVEWSVYNIPYSTYYDKTENWLLQAEKLKKLLETVDVLTPALYDFYPDTTRFTDDRTYIIDNLKIALEAAKQYNKPVMPYIWHRWHDGNPKDGLKLIDAAEFKKHISLICKTNVDGVQVSGLIWFGAQSYFHKVKPELIDFDLKKVGGNKSQIKETILKRYAKLLTEVIKAGKS